MQIGWGWKITLLYSGFVALILFLVISSSRQQIDLVSKNYYEQEIRYQDVINAGKNQSGLSAALGVSSNANTVTISFPEEFKGKAISGNVQFYAPVNAAWDKSFTINAENNAIIIPRSELHDTRYIVKISCIADGKNFYQETELMLQGK